MSDPLSLVPFALAARDGVIDGWPVRQLVAAGIGLLRGSAPVVRALAGRDSAIVLPPGPAVFVALAASDGRCAHLLDPAPNDAQQPLAPSIGAVMTLDVWQGAVPAAMPRILLDEAPVRARFVSGERKVTIDLALHDGLALEGDPDAPGSNEEMLRAPGGTLTHRALLTRARATMAAARLGVDDHVLAIRSPGDSGVLAAGEIAALLAGARVTTATPNDLLRAIERLEQLDVTVVVSRASTLDATCALAASRKSRLDVPALRMWVTVGTGTVAGSTATLRSIAGREIPQLVVDEP